MNEKFLKKSEGPYKSYYFVHYYIVDYSIFYILKIYIKTFHNNICSYNTSTSRKTINAYLDTSNKPKLMNDAKLFYDSGVITDEEFNEKGSILEHY